MSSVRDRNASAWLIPNDGTRTNHRLRADMRRFGDTDEVTWSSSAAAPADPC